MNEQQKLLDPHLSKDFKKLAHNFEYKLKEIMRLTNDAEGLYILNLILLVIEKRFKGSLEEKDGM